MRKIFRAAASVAVFLLQVVVWVLFTAAVSAAAAIGFSPFLWLLMKIS